MSDDIKNTTVSKIFSMEFLGLIIGGVFAFGMGYNALAETDKQLTADVSALSLKQDHIESTVTTIQIDVAAIKAHQEEQSKLQELQSRQQREDMQNILRMLERR